MTPDTPENEMVIRTKLRVFKEKCEHFKAEVIFTFPDKSTIEMICKTCFGTADEAKAAAKDFAASEIVRFANHMGFEAVHYGAVLETVH